MTLDSGIDMIDYAILQVLQEPLWKSKIHAALENQTDLPIDNLPSIQTVGRRVDELTRNDLLTTAILSPDELERDLIIGYKRVKKGDTTISQKRIEILQELAHTHSNTKCAPQRTVSKPALVRMIAEEFDLDETDTTRLDEQHDEQVLLALLTLHYAQKNADDLTSDLSHTYSQNDVRDFKHLLG